MRLLFILFFCLLYGKSFTQQRVRVNPIFMDSSFDAASLEKLRAAVQLMDSVYNSDAFAKRVLQTDFTVGTYGLSSAEILELITSGMDNYKDKPKDYSIDLRVSVFDDYKGFGNYGVTNPTTRITATHRCYILNNNVKCYASHLAHEYMHQIGFDDDRSGILRKKTHSVPYKIGDIFDEIIGNDSQCTAQKTTCLKQ